MLYIHRLYSKDKLTIDEPLLPDMALTDTRKTGRTEHREIDPFVCELVAEVSQEDGLHLPSFRRAMSFTKSLKLS